MTPDEINRRIAAEHHESRDSKLMKLLREIEQNCPCGARPESPVTHPHVIGCPVAGAIHLMDEEVKQSTTQTVEWVPVGERLPEEVGEYLLAHQNGKWGKGSRAFGRSGAGEWVWNGRLADEAEITHWAEPLKHPSQLEAGE